MVACPGLAYGCPVGANMARLLDTGFLLCLEPFGFQHLVRPSVSADEEPQLAGGTVIPPLGLLPGDVRPVVEILRPLPLGRRAIRPLAGRAAVVILPHGPASAVGAVDLKGHFGFLNSEFGFRTGRRI